eukprot:XP_010650011.1 PREDICTED: disease resistance protein RPM1 [Vitis vinifera]
MAAEGTVTFLLDKLVPLLKLGSKLLKDVHKEVDYIVSELERIKAFLRFADAREETDPELKVWVKQVREVADEMEDVVDEFRLCPPPHHGHGLLGSIQKIARFSKDFKAQNQLVSRIQGIKSKVQNISEGHERYRGKFDGIEQGFGHGASTNTWYDSRGDALLVEESELVGIDKPKQKLIGMLLDDVSRTKVVSVVGMGGLGKTTLVKKVYDDVKVEKSFQHHAWITVSSSKIEDLLRDLIQQLFEEGGKPVPQGIGTLNADRLKALLNYFLRQKKYIIILDNVWRIFMWESVKYAFPNSRRGSRILVTTRNSDIAGGSCVESDGDVFPLNPLPPTESWTLFCRKAFRRNACPPHLNKLSQGILKRCEGLSLAIVAIGGVLATKDQNRMDEWDIVDRSLSSELESNDKLERVNKILSLGYNDLPYYLKHCFLYLSIFPEDHLIEHKRLIRLWIAEGFVVPQEGKMPEEVAESYLRDLTNRCLIQVAQRDVDGRIKTYRIHDLIRQIIISKSRDQDFVTIIRENNTATPNKARHLSARGTLETCTRQEFPGVRSLLIFGVDSVSKSCMSALFSGDRFGLLRVLDLRGLPLEKFPEGVVNLFHLRYLSLRGTKVDILPSSIGKLPYLETLDLKQTKVSKLPAEIQKLQNLRHLLLYRCVIVSYVTFHSKEGFLMPERIGDLQFLQKLCFVEPEQGGHTLTELGKLSQLRKLGIIKLRKEDGRSLCSSIEKMKNLGSLDVTSLKEEEIIDLNHLSSPPLLLKGLYLKGRLEDLPGWIPTLDNLSKISLRWSRLKNNPLEALQALPNLVQLQLLHAYEGEALCFKAGGFQKLKSLKLDRLEELRKVSVEWGALTCLQELSILRCQALKQLPFGIQYLSQLQQLCFYDMPDEFARTLLRAEQGYDYWKIKHIPKVFFIYSENGRWSFYHL